MSQAAEAIDTTETTAEPVTPPEAPKKKPDPSHPDPERAERVQHVLALLMDDKWEPGVTAPTLAELWKISTATVERMGVEARQIVRFLRTIRDAANAVIEEQVAEIRALRAQAVESATRLEALEQKVTGASASSLERRFHEMARRTKD